MTDSPELRLLREADRQIAYRAQQYMSTVEDYYCHGLWQAREIIAALLSRSEGLPNTAKEVKAALDEAATRLGAYAIPRSEGEHCQACGRAYDDVYSLPDDIWARISPRAVEGFAGGGLLCPTCALERVTALLPRADAYRKRNPLGGPAAMFETIAERLRAGEDYDAVLADYDLVHVGHVKRSEGETNARKLVNAQAEDDALWFEAQTASEGYLKAALRQLHAAVEGETNSGGTPSVPHGQVESPRASNLPPVQNAAGQELSAVTSASRQEHSESTSAGTATGAIPAPGKEIATEPVRDSAKQPAPAASNESATS